MYSATLSSHYTGSLWPCNGSFVSKPHDLFTQAIQTSRSQLERLPRSSSAARALRLWEEISLHKSGMSRAGHHSSSVLPRGFLYSRSEQVASLSIFSNISQPCSACAFATSKSLAVTNTGSESPRLHIQHTVDLKYSSAKAPVFLLLPMSDTSVHRGPPGPEPSHPGTMLVVFVCGGFFVAGVLGCQVGQEEIMVLKKSRQHPKHFPASPLGQYYAGSLLLNFGGPKRSGVLDTTWYDMIKQLILALILPPWLLLVWNGSFFCPSHEYARPTMRIEHLWTIEAYAPLPRQNRLASILWSYFLKLQITSFHEISSQLFRRNALFRSDLIEPRCGTSGCSWQDCSWYLSTGWHERTTCSVTVCCENLYRSFIKQTLTNCQRPTTNQIWYDWHWTKHATCWASFEFCHWVTSCWSQLRSMALLSPAESIQT